MKKLFIVGAGGLGREVLWLAQRVNEEAIKNDEGKKWDIKGFIDDDKSLWGQLRNDYPVLGGCEYLETAGQAWVVIAVGSGKIKKFIAKKLKAYDNVHFATLIDPSTQLSRTVEIGEGSILCAGTILTVNIRIGKHVIINLDCTVGHDVLIEDYVTVYPGVNISGNCTIGAGSELGTGMQIIQGRSVGEKAIIGAGAVVVKNIPGYCVAVGNPAKSIKTL